MGKWSICILSILALLGLTGCKAVPSSEKPTSQVEKKQEETIIGLSGSDSSIEQLTQEIDVVPSLSVKETQILLQDNYGLSSEEIRDNEPFNNTTTSGSLMGVIEPFLDIEYTSPIGEIWPQDVEVMVDSPDVETLLQQIDFQALSSKEELFLILETHIAEKDCPRRKRTLTVSFPSSDFDLKKTQDFELLDALYGGALSYYRGILYEDYLWLYEMKVVEE